MARLSHFVTSRTKRLVPDHISFEQISDEIQNGYDLLDQRETGAACDAWWRAWQWVKGKVNAPRDPLAALSRPLPRLQDIYNWCLDFEMELGNAGVDDPAYYRLCIRYCQEFLAAFPYLGWDMRGNFLRAEAEAHWNLGEIEVAEQKFVALIAQNPDWAWGYIGWSDQFWFFPSSPKNYRRAEEILQQALARPNLEDRNDVLERLSHLRKEKPLLPAPASSTPTKKTSAPAPSRGRDKHKRKKKSRKH